MSLTQTAAAEAFMSGGPARIKAGYLNALARVSPDSSRSGVVPDTTVARDFSEACYFRSVGS